MLYIFRSTVRLNSWKPQLEMYAKCLFETRCWEISTKISEVDSCWDVQSLKQFHDQKENIVNVQIWKFSVNFASHTIKKHSDQQSNCNGLQGNPQGK